MSAAAAYATPDVCQLGFDEENDRYWAKSASSQAYWEPQPVFFDRRSFLKFAGPEATKRVDTEGTVTLTTKEKPQVIPVDTVQWEPVTTPGLYKVRTPTGQELTGWVIPSLVDVDGHQVPMAVFSNGSVSAVQDQILGVRLAESRDLPVCAPKGQGIFFVLGHGGLGYPGRRCP
jgi:hypothetical protein